MKIAVAGATGDLGFRIVEALQVRGGSVVALCRPGTTSDKLARLKKVGADVAITDMTSASEVAQVCTGADCVVSALAGLRDVIVDAQTTLLNGAVKAGVTRFIPSDFCTDWTELPTGENRNYDLRREFHEAHRLAQINLTSIRNGAFAEVLSYSTPLLNFKQKVVQYWGEADHLVDFTTMNDSAAFTAAAALDPTTPEVLQIASFQASPIDLAAFSERVLGKSFKMVHMGTLQDLRGQNIKNRAANPSGEDELYPAWQQQQYVQAMLSVTQKDLANRRYPNIAWTTLDDAVPLEALIKVAHGV